MSPIEAEILRTMGEQIDVKVSIHKLDDYRVYVTLRDIRTEKYGSAFNHLLHIRMTELDGVRS